MNPLTHPLFLKFIIYFNDNQDFFECHEVLEEYWNTFPERTKAHPLTAYILLSTAMYHWRRGNDIGAVRSLKKAQRKMNLMADITPTFTEGLDFEDLLTKINQSIAAIENGKAFIPFPIKVTSLDLLKSLEALTPKMQLLPYESEAIIHKHLLRDRTEVINLRNEKKKGRLL